MGSRRRPLPSTAEPASDIQAQTRALADPTHPKNAVFIAGRNPVPSALPKQVKAVQRPEGTLLTTDSKKAAAFQRGVSDGGMARLLGYPETKAQAMRGGMASVIQAHDAGGNVVTEALTSPKGQAKTVKALAKHVPAGGRLVQTTPLAAQMRRSIRGK